MGTFVLPGSRAGIGSVVVGESQTTKTTMLAGIGAEFDATLAAPAYSTWSTTDKSAGATLSGGNLTAAFSSGNPGIRSADRVRTGQFYWEVTFTKYINTLTGICTGGTSLTGLNLGAADCAFVTGVGGQITSNASSAGAVGGTSGVNGWLICVALDATLGRVWFRNGAAGNWNGSATANPVTNVGGIDLRLWGVTPGQTDLYACANGGGGSGSVTANFGASAFTGTAPSGFTAGLPGGTTINLAAISTQTAIEQWGGANANAQLTQVAIEQWSTPTWVGVQALLTQIALEQWGAVAVTATTAPIAPIVVIMA